MFHKYIRICLYTFLLFIQIFLKISKELLIFDHIYNITYNKRRVKVKKMKQNSTIILKDFMKEFANNTGLEPENNNPKRYLWTDAFAVCNFLELYNQY